MEELLMNEINETVTEKFPATAYQDVNVCMPVSIKAHGEVGKIQTQCIGRPTITPGCGVCPGKCHGECKFIITQKIRVKIPVVIRAKADVGEAAVECKDNGYEEREKCGCNN